VTLSVCMSGQDRKEGKNEEEEEEVKTLPGELEIKGRKKRRRRRFSNCMHFT
jgi:hypothetical protein